MLACVCTPFPGEGLQKADGNTLVFQISSGEEKMCEKKAEPIRQYVMAFLSWMRQLPHLAYFGAP